MGGQTMLLKLYALGFASISLMSFIGGIPILNQTVQLSLLTVLILTFVPAYTLIQFVIFGLFSKFPKFREFMDGRK
jgi:hypothetical protein